MRVRLSGLATALAAACTVTVLVTPAAGAGEPDRRQASAGCGNAAPQRPGTSRDHTIGSGGLDRTYRLHLPDGYDAARPWPVVLAFHGRGNDAVRTEAFSKLSALPAVVVYPNGAVGLGDGERQAWQGAPYSAPGVDDVAFTADLLDRLERDLCVDTGRVYATGKSNGGGFTGLLACRMSDRIAAVAPVAGAFYPGTREACAPDRAVPVIEFHGTGDSTIPYAGDSDRELPPVPDWVAGWAARDDCRARPATRRIEPDITITRHAGCDEGAQVHHVAVTGGGHTWPGADSYSGGGRTTQTIEAHEVLWRFVSRHRLAP
ncbi:polyhydroxybutyrate depolymerase [Prauserella isguenensis]|uniref:Polyhydroxybutyrate depolymerase n=1 Tax=Prauserella isguenensis TaxID=1470180 RepID=A0A839S2Z2_9PSEU|nr:PHB depolymerase family esterase [Prauserella isguenensis]MBB3051663.1 polyhydroxybutyrate depolymerase [Prauserella isguenensis]